MKREALSGKLINNENLRQTEDNKEWTVISVKKRRRYYPERRCTLWRWINVKKL